MPGPLAADPAPVPDSAVQHFVTMRDGVRLATDVYLPRVADGARPVILTRLPYDKNSRYVFMETVAARFVAAGYVMVVQDVRGKFRSEGHAAGPVNEVWDGYDTIEWVTRQEWSDGVVGMFGDSYYGLTQWSAVSSAHPALRAIVPRVTSTRIARWTGETDGVVRDIDALSHLVYFAQCWAGPLMNEKLPDWRVAPITEMFERFFDELGHRSTWYDLMMPRPLPVPVFPNGHPFDAPAIPVLHTVGWFDNLGVLSMRDYTDLMARPDWAPLQYLHADSTDHENLHLSDTPIPVELDHSIDQSALERMMRIYTDPAIEFFDVFLKRTAPLESVPRVRWHLGHVGYQTAEAWPPPAAVPTALYLRELAGEARTLATTAPEAAEECTWSYDPLAPVLSAIQNPYAFLLEYPDERAYDERDDVIGFSGAVAVEPLDIAGQVDVWIRVASTAPAADVHAKLYDVAPDGAARLIVRGQAEILLADGEHEARIELGHTGYRVRPGHRLRLQLCSTDYPEFPPASGTDADRWSVAERVGSVQTLRTDALRPSRLVLHTLPPGADITI